MDEVLGPLTAHWGRKGYGVCVLHVVVGTVSVEHQCARIAPPPRGERGERFTHVRPNDDIARLVDRKEHLQVMAVELAASVEKEKLAIKWEKVHHWSCYRPDFILIQRNTS